jgi:hypothetical protein
MFPRIIPITVALLSLSAVVAGVGEAPLAKAHALLAAGDWPGATAAYRALAEGDPGSGAAWFGLGQALSGGGDSEEAIGAFEKAIDLEFQVELATYEIARSHASGGDGEQAIAWLRRLAAAGSTARQLVTQTPEFEPLRGTPEFEWVLEELQPCRAPEYRQFDFWLGEWSVRNAARPERPPTHNKITAAQDGCVVVEEYDTPAGYTGVSLSYYDAATDRWYQTWVDNQGVPIVHSGGLRDGKMVLTDSPEDGKIHRTTWSPLADGRVRQLWESSNDGGESWTTVFDGYYAKQSRQPGTIASRPRTDNRVLAGYLERIVNDLDGEDGDWSFEYGGVRIRLITDEDYDRVRIVAPIARIEDLEEQQVLATLHANFDRAIDARYAMWQGGVWSVFAHPLGELSKGQLISAIRQVASLVRNFGTSYSSMDIDLGAGG